jgi:hypothetical protein
MRLVAVLAIILAFAAGARTQAEEPVSPPAQQANPNLNIDAASLPSARRAPALDAKPAKRNDSIFSGVDLGGSTLNFEGDRKPPDNRMGAESFEPGTLVSRKSRAVGPSYFGLSIKKSLE